MARDAIKLALPGFHHLVEVWGLPTRPEWAQLPIVMPGLPNWVLGWTHGPRASA